MTIRQISERINDPNGSFHGLFHTADPFSQRDDLMEEDSAREHYDYFLAPYS